MNTATLHIDNETGQKTPEMVRRDRLTVLTENEENLELRQKMTKGEKMKKPTYHPGHLSV